ncbi:uncharacterized protein LOC113518078 [Galleria mellonella]|uniref:RING-type E3 ubiquitin transferase n=1 Tax=Galleria mellonella TaxID=7137 RepID=A0A6J1WSE1_GALME|nr:uncharacterized protein LOC113518078 [Galleria mellonella]
MDLPQHSNRQHKIETVSEAMPEDSSDAKPSSVKSGSSSSNCPICLGTCEHKSFTDSCLHQFCFKCIFTWSKVKTECPLCKQNFKSIIHNVISSRRYERYMVEQREEEETIERLDNDGPYMRKFTYMTTLTLSRHEGITVRDILAQCMMAAELYPPPAPESGSASAPHRRPPLPIFDITIEKMLQSNTDDDDDSSEPKYRTREVVDLDIVVDGDVIGQDTVPSEITANTRDAQKNRPKPSVKLTSKRRIIYESDDSDSDESVIRPPAVRRRRRLLSDDSTTTSDTCRTTACISLMSPSTDATSTSDNYNDSSSDSDTSSSSSKRNKMLKRKTK